MLVRLLEIPKSAEEWSAWSWSHRTSHVRIISAIKQKNKVDLTEYPVDPINFDRIGDMLAANQAMHLAFSGILKLQSVDLESVDFRNESQKAAWVYLHYKSHYDAENALGV